MINKSLSTVAEAVKSKARLGAVTVQKINLFIELFFDSSKADKYYSKIFEEEPSKILAKGKALGL